MSEHEPYVPNEWEDGENKYNITDQDGNIVHQNVKVVYVGTGGSPVSAQRMNKLETQYAKAKELVDEHKAETAILFNKVKQDIGEVDYNVYQLYLQMYYDNKHPLKKGIFFDGFADTNIIDVGISTIVQDTIARQIRSNTEPVGDESIHVSETSLLSSGGLRVGYSTTRIGGGGYMTMYAANGIGLYITKFVTQIKKVGSPTDDLVCKVIDLSNEEVLGESDQVAASQFSDSYKTATFTFSTPVFVAHDVQFAVIVYRTGSISSTNYVYVAVDSKSDPTADNFRRASDEGPSGFSLSKSNYGYGTLYIKDPGFVESIYQSEEIEFEQEMSNAVLYIKHNLPANVIIASIAIYNGVSGEFEQMDKETTREIEAGVYETKYTYSTEAPGTKVKIKLIFPASESVLIAEDYGCLLGVF